VIFDPGKTFCTFMKCARTVSGPMRYVTIGCHAWCGVPTRGVTRGHNSPGAEKSQVQTMSQALSSIQHICFRKTSGSNMGARFLPGAPCNLVTTLVPK